MLILVNRIRTYLNCKAPFVFERHEFVIVINFYDIHVRAELHFTVIILSSLSQL